MSLSAATTRTGSAVRSRGRLGAEGRRASPRLSVADRSRQRPTTSFSRRRLDNPEYSLAVVACAATSGGKGSSGDSEWQKKYDKAVNEDLPKFWKSFRKQATLRYEILADDARRGLGKLDRKLGVGKKTDYLRNEIYVRFETIDNKYGITTKVKNSVDELRRRNPDLKRKFDKFASTPTGKALGIALFVWGVFSGVYLKLLYVMFLISLFSPLFLPYLQQFVLEQQQKEQERNTGAFNTRNSWFDRFTQDRGGPGGSNQRNKNNGRGGGGRDDDIVIDAEFKSIDDE